MPAETSFAKIKYALAADEVKAFPAEVSEPGAKTIDKALEEKILRIKKYAASSALVSGELAIQEKTAETFTLPAATANFVVGAFSTVAETKVTTSGGAKIFGDFLEAAGQATIVLTTNQHVTLYADGVAWRIVAGEAKREGKYEAVKSFTKAEAEAGIEPSATRMAFVVFKETPTTLTVGGVPMVTPAASGILVPPGQKWQVTVAATVSTLLL